MDRLDMLQEAVNGRNRSITTVAERLRSAGFTVTGSSDGDLDVDPEVQLADGITVQLCTVGGGYVVTQETSDGVLFHPVADTIEQLIKRLENERR